jgi:antirestriction protein ArdC
MTSDVLSNSKMNVYSAVTQKIISAIEEGTGEYKMPWHVPAGQLTIPTNALTKAEYRGVNVLGLWLEAVRNHYPSGFWASYKQWKSMGAQVRHGERGALVVFYRRQETQPAEREDHDRSADLRFFARASWVFNAAQVEGFSEPKAEVKNEFARNREAEEFVKSVGAEVNHGFTMACYRPSTDTIEMPHREWFVGTSTSSATESYYATIYHELTHWVGAPHRLNRVFGKRFGDHAYAMEELVAEIGSAFVCAALGITPEPRADHAAYVASWLKILKQDNRAIFTAASKAQEAFEHLAYLAMANRPPMDG